jgi:hypothetical protein
LFFCTDFLFFLACIALLHHLLHSTTACLIRATYSTIKKKVIKSGKWHIHVSQLQLYISRVDIFNLFLNTVYLYDYISLNYTFWQV